MTIFSNKILLRAQRLKKEARVMFRMWQFLPDGAVTYLSRAHLVKPLLSPHMTEQLAQFLSYTIAHHLDVMDHQQLFTLFMERAAASNAQKGVERAMLRALGFNNLDTKNNFLDSASDIQLRWFMNADAYGQMTGGVWCSIFRHFTMCENENAWWQYIHRLQHISSFDEPDMPMNVQKKLVQDKKKLMTLMDYYKSSAERLFEMSNRSVQEDPDVLFAALCANPSAFRDLFYRLQPDVWTVCQMIHANPFNLWETILPRVYMLSQAVLMTMHYYNDCRIRVTTTDRSAHPDPYAGFCDDMYVMSFAVTAHNVHLADLSPRLCADASFALHLLALGLDAIPFISETLLQDRDFVASACKRMKRWQYASNRILYLCIREHHADDREIILLALQHRLHHTVYKYASERLKQDRYVTETALHEYPQSLEFAPGIYQADIELVRQAITADGSAIAYAAYHLQRRPDLIMLATKTHADILFNVPRRLPIPTADFILDALNVCEGDIFPDLWQFCLQYMTGDNYDRFRHLLLERNALVLLHDLPPRFLDDVEFLLEYTWDKLDLAFLARHPVHRHDRRIEMLLIKSCFTLWNTSQSRRLWRHDVEMMALVVSRSILSLFWAPEHLMKPILQAARQKYHIDVTSIYAALPAFLRDDEWLTRLAVQRSGRLLEFASDRLRNMFSICHDAFIQDPYLAEPHIPYHIMQMPYMQALLQLRKPFIGPS